MLPDGRVVSGGDDGKVLVWDPSLPGSLPIELGTHDGGVSAVAVLPDGRVVSAGEDRRVLVRDVTTPTEFAELDCSVSALAAQRVGRNRTSVTIAHRGGGFSFWSIATEDPRIVR